MAHQVQAGNARPKIQSPIGTWFLGLITLGTYTVYWWYRTHRDLATFESSDGSPSAIRPGLETGLLGGALIALAVVQVAMRETVTAMNFDGTPVETSQLTPAGTITALVLTVGLWVISGRMRSHAKRVMTRAGLLPEEQPGAVGFWAVTVIFSAPGASCQVQGGLNKLWERYPRWYSSIGGTKEEVLGGAGAPAVAAPGLGIAAPLPAGVPGAAPSPAATLEATAVLTELGARAQAGQLDAASAFRYAQAVEQVHGAEAAAPWYEYVANSDPSNAMAMYRTGAWRVARSDASGMQYLHRAAQDPALRAQAANAMAGYLERAGRTAEAAQWRAYAA